MVFSVGVLASMLFFAFPAITHAEDVVIFLASGTAWQVPANWNSASNTIEVIGGGGASHEVWFVFRENLYQISTCARLDNLLQEMFSTWSFF